MWAGGRYGQNILCKWASVLCSVTQVTASHWDLGGPGLGHVPGEIGAGVMVHGAVL